MDFSVIIHWFCCGLMSNWLMASNVPTSSSIGDPSEDEDVLDWLLAHQSKSSSSSSRHVITINKQRKKKHWFVCQLLSFHPNPPTHLTRQIQIFFFKCFPPKSFEWKMMEWVFPQKKKKNPLDGPEFASFQCGRSLTDLFHWFHWLDWLN